MSEANTMKEQSEFIFKSDLLKGKKGLVLGVANKRSIAWGISQALMANGAELAFAYQGDRLKEKVEELVSGINPKPSLYPCDVTKDEEIKALFDQVGNQFGGGLDFLVHCIAFAQKEDLSGRTVETSRGGFQTALDISTYSLIALSRAAEPLLEKNGGSVLALTYLGSEKVIPFYNVMGVAKAGLESAIRYLAHDLGKKNIRVNGISAGPISTLSARGIAKFTDMLEMHRNKACLGRNVELHEIGNAGLFLLSPLSSGITGEILYVDCGYRIVG